MSRLTKSPKAEQWADQICTQLGKSVESIIEVGRLLVKAQTELEHGEWGRMFNDDLVPFSIRTAQRLMAVSEHPVLSNTTHGSHLPPSWRTLYELSRVEPKTLTNAIKDGVITPDMPRKSVAALLPTKTPTLVAVPELLEPDDFDAQREILKVVHAIRSAAAAWPNDVSWEPLIARLYFEADRLKNKPQEKRAS